MPTAYPKENLLSKDSNYQDLVFKIEDKSGHVIDYFGPDVFFSSSEENEVVGKPIHQIIGAKSYKEFRQLLKQGSSSIVSYYEEPIEINDRLFDLSMVYINEYEKLVILKDKTESVLSQSRLKESENKFKDVFNSIVDVYYKTNSKREFIIISPSIERIAGLKPENFIGKKTSDFIKPTKADEIYQRLAKDGIVEDFRVNFKFPSGEFKVFSFNIEAEFDSNGKISGTNGIIRDISKQASYENEITTSEKKFKEIFSSISDIYFRSDANAVVEIISPSVETVMGYKPEEVLGKKERSFYKDPKVNDLLVKHLKTKGFIRNAHGELISKNREVKNVSLTASANFDKKGKYIGSNGIIRDITKEKKESQLTQLNRDILEKVARESDLKEILNYTCLGIEKIFPEMTCSVLLMDETNNYLVKGASPSLPKYYVNAADKIPVGPNIGSCGTAAFRKELVVVSDIANDPKWKTMSPLAKRAKLKACWSMPILSSQREVLGTFAIYYKTIKEPIKRELDLINNIQNILSIAIENTRNKQELIANEKRYRSLVNNSPVAILIHANGTIKFVNNEVLRIAKTKNKQDLLQKEISLFIVEKDNKSMPKTAGRSEKQFARSDHSMLDIEVMESAIEFKGNPAVQLIFYDISERKALERKQNKLNEFLIKQNRQLEEFAHIASHNLRAPIANIFSLLRIYEMDSSEQNSKFVMEQLNNTSINLYDTINELTEVIKTSWELNKQKQEMNFSGTLKRVKQGISNEISVNEAAIEENFEEVDRISYPKVYLESIMQNLLSNSIKYRHPKRKPIIKISTKKKNGNIMLIFKDNGLGIDLEKHKNKMFGLHKTFHKNENARGVGLFITKTQIESMGGTIEVKSKINKGSEFCVNFGIDDH